MKKSMEYIIIRNNDESIVIDIDIHLYMHKIFSRELYIVSGVATGGGQEAMALPLAV